MRILTLGDVVGSAGIEHLDRHLWQFRSRERIDAVIANGENATEIRGLSAEDAKMLLGTGIDLLTLGNHAFGRRDLYSFLDSESCIIRPANYPPAAPGNGYTVLRIGGVRLLCINVCGRVYMDPLASPFETVDKILEREKGAYDLALLDIHAEATSEKLALARYFDGRINVIFGTHTHVPTADLQLLPNGSGYVTDLGMCGPVNGILGTATDAVLERFMTLMPTRFSVADGKTTAQGVIFDLDDSSLRVTSLKRVEF